HGHERERVSRGRAVVRRDCVGAALSGVVRRRGGSRRLGDDAHIPMIDVRLLTESDDDRYETLVRRRPSGLLYASVAWRRFLTALRPQFEPAYLGAFHGPQLVGALPGMIAEGP